MDGTVHRGENFLSCLCGSEQLRSAFNGLESFLSCLCGSEHSVNVQRRGLGFLSCLCGSEHENLSHYHERRFSELPVRQ